MIMIRQSEILLLFNFFFFVMHSSGFKVHSIQKLNGTLSLKKENLYFKFLSFSNILEIVPSPSFL